MYVGNVGMYIGEATDCTTAEGDARLLFTPALHTLEHARLCTRYSMYVE